MIRAEGVVRAPYGKAATALLAERDVAAAATRVLAEEGHSGATYVLTGQESLTQIEQADAIGAAIGRRLCSTCPRRPWTTCSATTRTSPAAPPRWRRIW